MVTEQENYTHREHRTEDHKEEDLETTGIIFVFPEFDELWKRWGRRVNSERHSIGKEQYKKFVVIEGNTIADPVAVVIL